MKKKKEHEISEGKLQSHRDSEHGFCTGCRNISHKQPSFSGLQSPRWSFSIKEYYSWVQTIFLLWKLLLLEETISKN